MYLPKASHVFATMGGASLRLSHLSTREALHVTLSILELPKVES